MAMVADKIGSIRLMRITAITLAISVYPLFYWMSIGGYWGALGGTIGLVILLCSFQSPIFASTVNALRYHGYRASFTAVILGSAAGIVGGITPAMMTSINQLSGNPYAPSYIIAVASAIGWIVLRRIQI
jgi:MHS family proline/betaine transporter-like MFS transporter